jgi:hypothetical protein
MSEIIVRFVVGDLTDEDLLNLKSDQAVISKLIITPDDFQLFNYREGDRIEVETEDGYRMWCTISNLEIVRNSERVIIILTLLQHPPIAA